jgi:precorrin-3B synthase
MTSYRLGTCPGLANPLPTGDGLLARFAVTHAMPLDRFAVLCGAARTHGNGIVEITSRGSIQIRGLTAGSAPIFAAAVEALDIADVAGGRVLTHPLGGLDSHETFDASGIAERLREAVVESGLAARLAPKVSVVVDTGGTLHLDAIPCDIRLRAVTASHAVQFHVTLAIDPAGEILLGAVAPAHAVNALLELLDAIAARGPTARARDLPLPAERGAVKPARSPAEAIGTHGLRDGSVALGIGLAFGHSDADALLKLLEEARRADTVSVRPAPGRALLMIGVPPKRAPMLCSAAERLGFITTPDDSRRRVVACAGAPACAAAQIPTRALAPGIAAAASGDTVTTIHLSGCAKGCAHPAPAALTIVGIDGKCGIVCNGRAQDVPAAFVTADDLPKFLAERAAVREAAHG